MKMLILSNTAWDNNNSFGNSFSSIFGGMECISIANIYCRYGSPNNNIVRRYFQITEKSLLQNLINKKIPSGKKINANNGIELNSKETNIFDYARKNRSIIFFWVRDLIWKIGDWKSKELLEFINEFEPDIIFQPIYYSSYLNDIVYFIKQYTDVPMIGYVSDDVYTMRQFSLSPLYWIDRLIKRKKIKRTVSLCEYLYVISNIQKEEYEKCFKKECKLLWKGAQFESKPPRKQISKLIKFVYTGNIGDGRYKQLALIGKAILELNKTEINAELDIYTLTPLSKKIKKALNLSGAINLKGGIPAEEVRNVQNAADILVHVESFDLKNRLAVHQSFSTKIVDYLSMAKCVLAVGPADVASIDYLVKNDAAIVATSKKEIEDNIRMLIEHTETIEQYGEKAWECGRRNHDIKIIQSGLMNDLERISNENNSN